MKLLSQTVRKYVLFSALLLLVSTPLFYFSIQQLFVNKMDLELVSHKQEFHELLPLLKTENDLKFFSLMNDEFLLTETAYPMKKDSLLTRDIYNEKEKAMHPYRMLRTGITIQGKPYVLQIQESMVDTFALISAIVAVQVSLIIFLLLGFVFINRKISKTVWTPFYTILDKLKKYQLDKDSSLDLPTSSTVEFRDLSFAISQLVLRNYEVFQSQKEFTENAAHELQTPLAIFRTKLELLAQTKELTQEQADLVGTLLDATDRITRLNKDLLLLSKIENRQFLETEEIKLRTIVSKCLDVYNHTAAAKELKVKFFMEEIFIKGNPILLEVLIHNVISNAIRHAPQGGSVIVANTKSCLTISNSGEPLEHPEKMFRRFHRESRMTSGSGLGLSIVKKICEVADYKVTYDFDSSMHHFKIFFGELSAD